MKASLNNLTWPEVAAFTVVVTGCIAASYFLDDTTAKAAVAAIAGLVTLAIGRGEK